MTAFPIRNAVIVIMAGGAGERFWPVSSRTVPKQLLRIYEGRTLLELAFDRACKLVPLDHVCIVAGRHLRESILNAVPNLDAANFIEEPLPRNTAPCLGLAASILECRYGAETVMGVLTADHLIPDEADFVRTVATAMSHAGNSDDLVTIGMKPTRPETAFGYLELANIESGEDSSDDPIYRVKRFTEKPPIETARDFLREGNYLWNSGMFFWKISSLHAAFDTHQPEMSGLWNRIRAEGESFCSEEGFKAEFEGLPSLPIDTAVMEHAENVVSVMGAFRWEDVGSWDALERVSEGDALGNHIFGNATAVDSENNIAYSDADDAGGEEIVLFGVQDLVVVRSGKAILVMPKSRSQDLKKLLSKLREDGRTDLVG